MSNLTTLPKGDSAWLFRKAIECIMKQISDLETNIGSSTTGNSANTQIIFNDNGVLRGDPDLTFNTALNKLVATALESTTSLVVGTSATITGDLTVDTNSLYVNSGTNNVGLGTLTPSGASGRALEIYGGAGQSRIALKNDTTGSASTDGSQIALVGSQLVIQNREASEITFETNNSERYRIASDGVATWSNVGGVAGTAMTLNSNGLGIGVSPGVKLDVVGTIRSKSAAGDTSGLSIWSDASSNGNIFQYYNGSLIFGTNNTERARINSTGAFVFVGGTANANGVGIAFPATQVASSDANTLDDYKESTWTPTITAGTGTPTTVTVNSANYTKIGRIVVINIDFTIVAIGTAAGALTFTLPFNHSGSSIPCGAFRENVSTGNMGQIYYGSGTTASCLMYNNATPWVNGYRIQGTYTYFSA